MYVVQRRSSPIVSLFPTTEFYNSAVTVVTYSLQLPINRKLERWWQHIILCTKNAYCHHFIHLVTWYKPTLFVHQTGQACAMNTIGLYGEHGKLVQPRNNDFPCQSIQNLDTSSVGSCSKFHEILYQVLPLHPASFPFGGEG